MKGWIYIISNKAMPALIKVGYTMKDPALRANELDNTGAPHPYVVEYEALLEDPQKLELLVHQELQAHREGKEWFRCGIEFAVLTIRRLAEDRLITDSLKRVAAEAVQKAQETDQGLRLRREQFRDEEQKLIAKYEELMRLQVPEQTFGDRYLICFGITLPFILFPAWLIFPPTANPLPVMVAGAVIPFIAAIASKDFFERRRQRSKEYRSLLDRRKDELAELQKRFGDGL